MIKMSVVFGALYLFFLFESVASGIANARKVRRERSGREFHFRSSMVPVISLHFLSVGPLVPGGLRSHETEKRRAQVSLDRKTPKDPAQMGSSSAQFGRQGTGRGQTESMSDEGGFSWRPEGHCVAAPYT